MSPSGDALDHGLQFGESKELRQCGLMAAGFGHIAPKNS